jgi:hypothetical protein
MEQKTLFKIPKIIEEVEIYHDEVCEGEKDERRPFGHQFLVIPTRSKDIFNEILMNERKLCGADGFTINWKKLPDMTGSRNKTANRWLRWLSEAMYLKPVSYPLDREEILCSKEPLGIKIGSFFINSMSEMSDNFWIHVERNEDKTKEKYETLLRMGVQGLLHYCFNPDYTGYEKVRVKKFYTDGEVFGAVPLNARKIIYKLEQRARKYIEISPNIEISPVLKSKEKTAEVNFEELTDLVLGSTHYLYKNEREEWKDKIIEPIEDIYKKVRRDKVGFTSSPHFRTFTVGYCERNENGDLVPKNWRIQTAQYQDASEIQPRLTLC